VGGRREGERKTFIPGRRCLVTWGRGRRGWREGTRLFVLTVCGYGRLGCHRLYSFTASLKPTSGTLATDLRSPCIEQHALE
jgi:hypothetical protein